MLKIISAEITDIPAEKIPSHGVKRRKAKEPKRGNARGAADAPLEIPDIDPVKMQWVTGKLPDAPIVKGKWGYK